MTRCEQRNDQRNVQILLGNSFAKRFGVRFGVLTVHHLALLPLQRDFVLANNESGSEPLHKFLADCSSGNRQRFDCCRAPLDDSPH